MDSNIEEKISKEEANFRFSLFTRLQNDDNFLCCGVRVKDQYGEEVELENIFPQVEDARNCVWGYCKYDFCGCCMKTVMVKNRCTKRCALMLFVIFCYILAILSLFGVLFMIHYFPEFSGKNGSACPLNLGEPPICGNKIFPYPLHFILVNLFLFFVFLANTGLFFYFI